MTRSVVGDALGASDRAEGYQIKDGEIAPADPIDMSWPFAAGAVRSTANDLMRWHRAISDDTILGAAARGKLYRVEMDGYAYGWVIELVGKHHTVWHNGGIEGFSTIFWRVADADLVVVAWSNVPEISADPIGKAAVEVALGGKVTPIAKEKLGTLDPAVVARVTGKYEITDDAKTKLAGIGADEKMIATILSIDIASTPHGLRMKPIGQDALELLPSSDGSFYHTEHQVRLRFELTGTGPVAAITIEQGKLAITYVRAK